MLLCAWTWHVRMVGAYIADFAVAMLPVCNVCITHIYGASRPSLALLIESTDSMISIVHGDYIMLTIYGST